MWAMWAMWAMWPCWPCGNVGHVAMWAMWPHGVLHRSCVQKRQDKADWITKKKNEIPGYMSP